MSNPYGTDPGSQPQGLGTPGSQGPQFVAPGGVPGGSGQYGPPQPPQYGGPPPGQPAQPYGQPGPYGAPGLYGAPGPNQQPFGYPTQPPAYAQNSQQQPYGAPGYGPGYPPRAPQPPRKRSSSTAIVIVVVIALVVGIAYGAYQLYQGTTSKPVTQSTPSRPGKTTAGTTATTRPSSTAKATATKGSGGGSTDCVGGDRITTAAFVATVPANWSCDGDDGDISISSTRNDAIWVQHDDGTGDLAGDCRSQVEDLGTVSALPQETWGGKTAVGYQAVDSGDIFGVRCAVVGSQTWYLLYFPLDPKDDAAVRADVTTVMKTWAWR